jgi:hypothetical protein
MGFGEGGFKGKFDVIRRSEFITKNPKSEEKERKKEKTNKICILAKPVPFNVHDFNQT